MISKLIIHKWFLLTWMIMFLPWQMSMLYLHDIMWKVKILSRFCSIICHENIMQISIMLHNAFSSRFNIFNYKLWDIFAYNIARFITLAICSKYAWIDSQTFTIFFVEIILTTQYQRKFELRKASLSPMVNHQGSFKLHKIDKVFIKIKTHWVVAICSHYAS